VYDVFDSASALELNPEVVTSTPGNPVYLLRFPQNEFYVPPSLIICWPIVEVQLLA